MLVTVCHSESTFFRTYTDLAIIPNEPNMFHIHYKVMIHNAIHMKDSCFIHPIIHMYRADYQRSYV
jgi:hypothetical protein